VLQTLGFPAHAEGNVICLRQERVNVGEACNRLSMMMMFFPLAAAVVLLARRPVLDQLVGLPPAGPLPPVCQLTPVAASAMLYVTIGHTLGDLLPFTQGLVLPGGQTVGAIDFHDLNGYLMMPLALGLLWLELRIIDWLLVTPAHGRRRGRDTRMFDTN